MLVTGFWGATNWVSATQFVARPVLERFVTVDATVKATENHKIPHHISDQGIVRVHLGIQNTHQDHNVTFGKPLLKCL